MIDEIISQSYSSNSYVITGERTILIDPGLPGDPTLETYFSRTNKTIDIIINTHCHYDHIGGNWDTDIYVHEDDADAVENGDEKTAYAHFTPTFDGFPVARRLTEGDTIDIGDHALTVVHTPGHTSGSICLLDTVTRTLFSGDTWFMNGIGRTDLPSGSFEMMERSFQKLRTVDADHVCPGHGPSFENNIETIYRSFFEVI
jgi:glyoxylase-like metal-dependent hydrolase (beta-lactamase superfamily II)